MIIIFQFCFLVMLSVDVVNMFPCSNSSNSSNFFEVGINYIAHVDEYMKCYKHVGRLNINVCVFINEGQN